MTAMITISQEEYEKLQKENQELREILEQNNQAYQKMMETNFELYANMKTPFPLCFSKEKKQNFKNFKHSLRQWKNEKMN